MADSDDTPRHGPKPRAQTHPDRRDVHTPKHPAKHAIPPHIDPEDSEATEDPVARLAIRGRRDTKARVARAEVRIDELARAVATISGQLDTLIKFADKAEERLEREARRKYIVPVIKAIGYALALVTAAIVGRGVLP